MPKKKLSPGVRKSVQKRHARKGNNKFWLFLGILLLLCLLLATYGRKMFLSWQASTWIPQTRLTVAVANKNPEIYSIDPETGKVLKAVIPANTQLIASFGYGNWLAGSLWALGIQEKRGGELLAKSVQKSFGIPVDAWIGEGGEVLFESNPFGFVSSYPIAVAAGRAKTNLTFYDRLSLLLKALPNEVEEVNLQSIGVLRKTTFPDGVEGYAVTPDKTKALSMFRDDGIFLEDQKLTIINSSSRAGLALLVGQISANLGLRVVDIQNEQSKVEVCEVRGNNLQLQSRGAKRLIQLFNCEAQSNGLDNSLEMQLILGEAFAKGF